MNNSTTLSDEKQNTSNYAIVSAAIPNLNPI